MIEFSWRSLGRRRAVPLIHQMEAAECGLACLAMIAGYHGSEIDLRAMRRRFGSSMKGITLARIIAIAHSMGFTARPVKGELSYLSEAPKPCILHWDLSHFVVLCEVSSKQVVVNDPARGRIEMTLAEASRHFTGILLELTPNEEFKQEHSAAKIPWRRLIGSHRGIASSLTQLMLLALVIELFSLTLPFQIQWVMDSVLVTQDKDLLFLISIGFAALVIFQAAIGIIRAWVMSWLGASLVSQWIGNLFAHLLRLPADFFEKRHMGDIVSRFSSATVIQSTLTGSLVTALLDGMLGGLSLLVMAMYSIPLTLVVVSAFAIYGSLRAISYRRLRRANEEQLIFSARQQTELMESVRGIKTIKLANKQVERTIRLRNATVEMADRGMVAQRVTMAFQAISQLVFGMQRVILIGVGAYMIIGEEFSAGMIVAFLAYADNFSQKSISFIDKVVELRMVRMHGERIADIVSTDAEKDVPGWRSGELDRRHVLAVRSLSFRYSDGEPLILSDLNFAIEPGEVVAITGVSGSGKSTLIKLLLGLLTPTEGAVEIDGMDIRKYGLAEYRDLLGAVMQEDSLFAGTIADNIAFFDPDVTLERVVNAAKLAELHDDIVTMPMGYESLVGDMGSSLSGGQRQRLVLARALYRAPQILILDEATSQLDQACEARIDRAVRQLDISRIIISHRPSTVAMADRVLQIEDGHVREASACQTGGLAIV
ncbi:peptidase domain-containing ABC transporter [Xanthomonas vasicola]|uniref:peptidase domain-containing ABC transporter n=2 Tax=Xanthomonas vasicola TaxID=56459 RepID=UPI000531EF74|nr:peptidase domain-containing ABC transporter [Xanthomonas vasicola]AZR35185.1 peptidase domain-containing ABC transporter [Xanthomonas vasicola]AZR36444.1 peptidase domain-containing ABC transporter [Xanthomonas vasicola]KGR50505.1 ABC transporter [Xanthomonas vasicola]